MKVAKMPSIILTEYCNNDASLLCIPAVADASLLLRTAVFVMKGPTVRGLVTTVEDGVWDGVAGPENELIKGLLEVLVD